MEKLKFGLSLGSLLLLTYFASFGVLVKYRLIPQVQSDMASMGQAYADKVAVIEGQLKSAEDLTKLNQMTAEILREDLERSHKKYDALVADSLASNLSTQKEASAIRAENLKLGNALQDRLDTINKMKLSEQIFLAIVDAQMQQMMPTDKCIIKDQSTEYWDAAPDSDF